MYIYIHIYACVYIYMCVCVCIYMCVCVCGTPSVEPYPSHQKPTFRAGNRHS